ncbi:MAG TPA: hypothetical protein VHK02_14855 [Actinomycetota bacterium]|nr:hypothetical protein [Actinomycetota bacterium]
MAGASGKPCRPAAARPGPDHVEVRRDGALVKVTPAEVVPGDVVVLRAGDIVPCDCRVLEAVALQVDDAALTGETFPRHKHPDPAPAGAPLAGCRGGWR